MVISSQLVLLAKAKDALAKPKFNVYGWKIQKKSMHTHHFGFLSRTREYLRRRVTRKFGDGIVGFLCLRGRILDDFAQLRKLIISQDSEWQMILVRTDKIALTAHLCK